MSECPHKQLKKQMVGEQIWYVCECDQKFRVEPWDGRVRLVEGLKVEEGQVLNGELFEAIQTVCAWEQDYRTRNNLGPKPPDCFIWLATLVAQHLKREQELAVPSWQTLKRAYDKAMHYAHHATTSEELWTAVRDELLASQPPQELVSALDNLLTHAPIDCGSKECECINYKAALERARAALTRGAVGKP